MASYPTSPFQDVWVGLGFLIPSAISPIIFCVPDFASTVIPGFTTVSPFITCEIIFPLSAAAAPVKFAAIIELPSVTLVLSTECPFVFNTALLVTWAPFCPTPSPSKLIVVVPSILTVESVVTIAPTPFDPFKLIVVPVTVTFEGLGVPLVPLFPT